MTPKSTTLVAIIVLIALVSFSQTASAQSTSISNSVSLTYTTVQLTYPSEVTPGQQVTVNVQASAKDYFNLQSLKVQVYYADGSTLRSLSTATIASNVYMKNGDKVNADIQTTIPAEAPRTSLVALVSETVRNTYYSYSYDYYPWNYYGGSSTYYPYYYGYYAYPDYYYASTTDIGIGPLSYIKATTPEYVTLQSEYQMVQQQLTQAQAQNQQLQQNLQDEQNKVSQRDATITDLNNQLASAHNSVQSLEILSGILAAVAIVLGVFLALKARGRSPQATAVPEKNTTKEQ
jgi:hypothetical protein